MASSTNWKRQRAIMNPTFSQSKLKEILPLMKMCSDRFIHTIDQNVGQEVNVTK